MPYFLDKYTDIVIAHQMYNPLNYAYLDALYLKYPLVHNASLMKDGGYYYDEFDADEGKKQLLYAINEHDKNLEEYEEKSKKVLDKYLPTNKKSIEIYDKLIDNLMKQKKTNNNLSPTKKTPKISEKKKNDGISIVMAYHNREIQLKRTLKSINESKYDKNKLQIIIVNDNSSKDQMIDNVEQLFNNLDISIINIKEKQKQWTNSCIPYNIGFNHIKYDKVIIQNPECYHQGDVISNVNENINDDDYISYACYSLDFNGTSNYINNMYDYNNIETKNISWSNTPHGRTGWYNHSVYNPTSYHFCSAITYNNLIKLNGFDERYKDGIGFDDNEILERIKNLKLNLKIINTPFVFHQYHDSSYHINTKFADKTTDIKNKLFLHNSKIFEEKTKKEKIINAVDNVYFNKNPKILEDITIKKKQHDIDNLYINKNKTKSNKIKIAHIINPYISNDENDNRVCNMTLDSMENSKDFTSNSEIKLYYTCYEEDLKIMEHRTEFIKLPLLEKSVLDYSSFNIPKKLPLLFDILDKIDDIDCDFIIYTNIDIHLMPNFYTVVTNHINDGYDSLTINRVTIFSEEKSDIKKIFPIIQNGEFHQGIDCFVFKKSILKKIKKDDFCIGTIYFDKYLAFNIHKLSNKPAHLLKSYLTFHIGDDKTWDIDKFSDYKSYNRNIYLKHFDIRYNGIDNNEHCKILYTIDENEHYKNKIDRVIDYSQFGEQKIILHYFKNNKLYNKSFLDIGAYHPTELSNTRSLYECGWNGYLVEPSFISFNNLYNEYKNEKRIKLINAAIGTENGLIKFNQDIKRHDKNIQNLPLSYTDETSEYFKERIKNHEFYEYYTPTITIKDLCDKTSYNFDFISLDVEGCNLELLKTFPKQLLKYCKLICVEFDNIDELKQIIHFLNENEFNLIVGKTVCNIIMGKN